MTTKTYDTDPKEKLYNVVKERGLYTRSFDEFKTKYSTTESIDNLYNVVNKRELFTKSKEDFYSQYFPAPVEKKSKVGGVSPTVSELKLNESSMDDIKAFVTGKTVEEVKANKQANMKPPAQITNAITQVKTSEPTKKNIDEEANRKIEKIADEDFADPLKGINKLSQANPVSAKDILATQKAKDILMSRIASDGFDAKQLLSRSFFGGGDENNLTTRELRNKEAKYDKSVAPLRELPTENIDQASDGYLDYNYKDKIYSAAVQAFAEKNPSFKKELEVLGIDPKDFISIRNKIPDGKMGIIVQEYFSDPDLATYLQKENPSLLPAFKHVEKTLLKDNNEFAINQVATKVSREVQKSGYNNIEPIFNYYGEGHKEYADQVANSILTPEELEVWNRDIKNNQEQHMDAPSFFQGFAEAGETFGKGIVNTFTQPFTSVSETIKENWRKEASHVSANPEGIFKIIRDSGHAFGTVASIAATGSTFGGLGLGANTANMTALGVGFLGDNLELGKVKYPDDPVKAWTSALVNTGLFMAMGKNIFPAAKVKQAFETIRPQANNIVENLTSGAITRESMRQEANTLLKKGIDFLGGSLKENAKISAHLTGIGILDRWMDKIMGLDEDNMNKYHPESQDTDTFTSMFLSNALVAGLSKYGEMRRGNKIMEESLYNAVTNPKMTLREIDKESITNRSFGNINEIKENFNHLLSVHKELEQLSIHPKDQKRFLFESLREKVAKEEMERTTDTSIQQKNKDIIKEAKEVKEKILNGEDSEKIVTETEQKQIEDKNKELEKTQKAETDVESLTEKRELDNKEFDVKLKELDKESPTYGVKKEKLEQQRKDKNEEYDAKIKKLNEESGKDIFYDKLDTKTKYKKVDIVDPVTGKPMESVLDHTKKITAREATDLMRKRYDILRVILKCIDK